MNLLERSGTILEKKVTGIRHFYKISGQRNVTLNEKRRKANCKMCCSMQIDNFMPSDGDDYSPYLYSLQEDEKNRKLYMFFLLSVLKWDGTQG